MTTTERHSPDLATTIERLRPLIEDARDTAEQERRLPDHVAAAMRDEGLFRLWLPKEYGGYELPLLPYIETVEALSVIDPVAGWMLANTGTGAVQAAFMPEQGANEVFGSGALGAGSIIPRGHATPVNGGYRVSGQWPLTSGCYNAQWLAGNCLVFESEAPRMGPGGIPDFTMAFMPAGDCSILDTWQSTGMRGTGSADFVARDVFVPTHRTFSLFTAQSRLPGSLFKMSIDMHFLTALSNVGLGIARAAIDAFVELARTKTPTLSQDGLATRPTVHAEVARAEARLQSARAFMHEVAREIDTVLIDAPRVPDELDARRRLACLQTAEACENVVDSMYRLGGASSIYQGNPLDRCLRDIHTVNQHMAVSPFFWEKTGQYYFGLGLGMP